MTQRDATKLLRTLVDLARKAEPAAAVCVCGHAAIEHGIDCRGGGMALCNCEEYRPAGQKDSK